MATTKQRPRTRPMSARLAADNRPPTERTARQVRYGVAMSLDGFIAGPNGEADWIVSDPEIDFKAIFSRFDAFLIGRKTYEAMTGSGGGGSGWFGPADVLIFSRTMRPADHPKLKIVSDDPGAAVNELRAKPGKHIWLFGGGELFRSLLEAGQVDGLDVAIIPVLLGSGIPLVPATDRVKLRLTGSRVYDSGIVSLAYDVERPRASRKSR